MKSAAAVALALLSSACDAKIYFKEQFNDDGWTKRWTKSSEWKKKSEMGKWEHTTGKWYSKDHPDDKGIQTSQDARFYGLSALMDEPFTQSEGQDLVLQYTVKFEQSLDCGGAYIKLAPKAPQESFGGDTPYQIMFGPDICGGTKKTHVIFNYPAKNDNLEMKKVVRPESDKRSHLYTLHLKSNGEYEVFIDEKSKQKGMLEEGFDFLEPKEIKDPKESKPADWVNLLKIADPEDVKPEGYDDIPAKIPDPEAEEPEDWDEEDDGEWEAPEIDNPKYKGPWRAKQIDNPDYKGEWEHPMIPNPDYKEDETLPQRCTDCGMVGFELWQVKSGTIFDDIIVTDSLEEAKAFAQETFFAKQPGEDTTFDAIEKERKDKEEAERKKREEEEAKKADDEGADDDEDYEDEDEPEDFDDEEEEHDEL